MIRKYEVCSGKYCNENWIEGSLECDTVEELVLILNKRLKDPFICVKSVGLTCEFSNSLDYREREKIKKAEYEMLAPILKEKCGVNICKYTGFIERS